MIASFETLLPVFLVIGLGFALRSRHVVPEEMWRGVELVAYWVFFPALLVDTLARADIASLPLGAITVTMVGAFFAMALMLLAARPILLRTLAIDGPGFSSLFQSATRWNGFIALPILAKLLGEEGVALVAVIIGALVPVANVMAVTVVARNVAHNRLSWTETAYVVFRNPFIWATAAGLVINFAGIPVYGPLLSAAGMLGGAAVGAGLLMVGAGLSTDEGFRPSPAVWAGTALKLLGTPLLVTGFSLVTGVTGNAYLACMVCASVPTAMSAYVLARQMGGDAPLVAATVTMQTIASFLTMPFVIAIAGYLR